MIVRRSLLRVSLLQHAWFVACLAFPAYRVTVREQLARGRDLAWYDHLGVFVAWAAAVYGAVVLFGLLLAAAALMARRINGSRGRRA